MTNSSESSKVNILVTVKLTGANNRELLHKEQRTIFSIESLLSRLGIVEYSVRQEDDIRRELTREANATSFYSYISGL